MLEISMPFLVVGDMLFLTSIVSAFVVGIGPMFTNSFFSENLEVPFSFISFALATIAIMIGFVLSFKFLIPIFIAMFAIGYILSIKFIPSWVKKLDKDDILIILESVTFPYYSTVILSVFWPTLIVWKLVSPVLKSISSVIQFKIETPNSALNREFKHLEKKK